MYNVTSTCQSITLESVSIAMPGKPKSQRAPSQHVVLCCNSNRPATRVRADDESLLELSSPQSLHALMLWTQLIFHASDGPGARVLTLKARGSRGLLPGWSVSARASPPPENPPRLPETSCESRDHMARTSYMHSDRTHLQADNLCSRCSLMNILTCMSSCRRHIAYEQRVYGSVCEQLVNQYKTGH